MEIINYLYINIPALVNRYIQIYRIGNILLLAYYEVNRVLWITFGLELLFIFNKKYYISKSTKTNLKVKAPFHDQYT